MRPSTRRRLEALERRPVHVDIPQPAPGTINTINTERLDRRSDEAVAMRAEERRSERERAARRQTQLLAQIATEISFIGRTEEPVKLTNSLLELLTEGKHQAPIRTALELCGRKIQIVEPGK